MKIVQILPAALCAVALGACHDELPGPSLDEKYDRGFIKEFGVPDGNQDWNLATSVSAVINTSGPLAGAKAIYVYDRMAGAAGCQLAAVFSPSSAPFSFDFGRGLSRAYVQAADAEGHVIWAGYAPVVDGRLIIGDNTTSRSSSDASGIRCVSLKEKAESSFGRFNFNLDCNRDYWLRIKGYTIQNPANTSDAVANVIKFYGLCRGAEYPDGCLEGEWAAKDDGRSMSELASIVGKSNGVFHEGAEGGVCNLDTYHERLHPENGIVYTSTGGEITLEYAYGAGIYDNTFGYFYYEEDATPQEIMEAPKFILMYDASPWTNLRRENPSNLGNADYLSFYDEGKESGITNESGMTAANDMENFESASGPDLRYKPSYHKLVYYPVDNGVPDTSSPSYNFPKGLKVGFFIICQGHQRLFAGGEAINVTDIRFSLPWMNQLFGSEYLDLDHKSSGQAYTPVTLDCGNGITIDGHIPSMAFVTYSWNGETIMGVEDGDHTRNDHDMNDILFFVRGVEDTSQEDLGTYPRAQSWVIACEDLGSTGDFDFNDVVFGVSYVATDKDTRHLEVKALAAGGTLPVRLWLNDTPVGDDECWNHWFEGVTSLTAVVNAGPNSHLSDCEGKSVIINDIPEDFRLSSELFRAGEDSKPMGGFKLQVLSDGHEAWVKAPGTEGDEAIAPQMILVPGKWAWPTEGTLIYEAYPGISESGIPGFRDWVHSSDFTSWSLYPAGNGKTVTNTYEGPVVRL